MSDQKKKELLRGELLAWLVARHPCAFDAEQLQRLVAEPLAASRDDLASALALLADEGLIYSRPNPLGATLTYTAPPAGAKFTQRLK